MRADALLGAQQPKFATRLFGAAPIIGLLCVLGGCDDAPRPTTTEIYQLDYARCKKDFNPCKGKFIKFDGEVSGVTANYVRVKTEIHGFDIFDVPKIGKQLIGSKISFSGYLSEKHFFNDDVVKGKIEAILMSASEVQAKKLRVAAELEAYEAAHPTCRTNWRVCTNNSDLMEHSQAASIISSVCQTAANEAARYGKPEWSWVPFGSYLRGQDYPRTGIITVIDERVKFQNGFGVYGASRAVCVYDMQSRTIVNLSIDPL